MQAFRSGNRRAHQAYSTLCFIRRGIGQHDPDFSASTEAAFNVQASPMGRCHPLNKAQPQPMTTFRTPAEAGIPRQQEAFRRTANAGIADCENGIRGLLH